MRRSVIFFLLGIILGGCQVSENPVNRPVAHTSESEPQAAILNATGISTGMVIAISVKEDAALNRHYEVPANGVIEYPPLGAISVVGQTPQKLAEQIKVGLEKDFFNVATVSVSIIGTANGATDGVQIMGCVERPGAYPWKPGLTLGEVVSAAGLNTKSRIVRLTMTRNFSGKKYRISLPCPLNNPSAPCWSAPLERGDLIELCVDKVFSF